MTAFHIEVRDPGIQAALTALEARLGNLQPILQTIGEEIMERAKERFATSTGPDGQRWKANAPATVRAYLAGGGKGGKRPLVGLSKSLMNQFHVRADARSVTVGNSMVYAAIQQFGGTIDVLARSQLSYFKIGKDGSVGNRFVGKKDANFAQWHTRGAHQVVIPPRPFLPIRDNGFLYPEEQAKILATLHDYLEAR